MDINWKHKLSSRKFWMAIIGFITPLLIIFNVETNTVEMVSNIIMSIGSLIAYILAEGWVDANKVIIEGGVDNE